MLKHKALGPTADRRFLVVYETPGCSIPTVACDCATSARAAEEVQRLNGLQLVREKVLQADALARGARGHVYPDLEDCE